MVAGRAHDPVRLVLPTWHWIRNALTLLAMKGILADMKSPKKILKGKGGTKLGKRRVGSFSVAFRISKGASPARESLLVRLRPEIRSLVKKTVTRYDADLRRLAKH